MSDNPEKTPRSPSEYWQLQIKAAFDNRDGFLGIPLLPVLEGWTTFVYAGYVLDGQEAIDCSGEKVISVPLQIVPLDTTLSCIMVERDTKDMPASVAKLLKKYVLPSQDTQIHVQTSELV